jgi:hypothetical protein
MRLPRVLLLGASLSLLAACGPTASPCNTATCGGCCSADGVCLDGSTNAGCGSAGLACNVCSGAQQCVEKQCKVVPVDAGVMQPQDAGTPIIAPVETWTWADFPMSACGNGTPTGVGVSISTKSQDLLIYLQGGGACWNALTCGVINSAANLSTGYGATQFAAEGTLRAPPFSRTTATNPFKDMSYVFVPYCTGDVHAGDAVQTYTNAQPAVNLTVYHKGARNLEAFLVRLKDTFPDARRVFLSGSSAGAFGAQLNYERVAATWPGAEVHVLADCGQMITPGGTILADWLAAWNFSIPQDCAGCATDFGKFPKYLHGKYPNRRFGLLAYTQDQTLRTFFGLDATSFQTATLGLAASAYDPTANSKYFVLAGQSHVMLGNLLTLAAPSPGPSLLTWTTQWVNGDASWANVKP